jgi:hypothetical protein
MLPQGLRKPRTETRASASISNANAVAPMVHRCLDSLATENRFKSQPQANQEIKSIGTNSMLTAAVSPRRGSTRRTLIVPNTNPAANTAAK